jgi:hypothetical protein
MRECPGFQGDEDSLQAFRDLRKRAFGERYSPMPARWNTKQHMQEARGCLKSRERYPWVNIAAAILRDRGSSVMKTLFSLLEFHGDSMTRSLAASQRGRGVIESVLRARNERVATGARLIRKRVIVRGRPVQVEVTYRFDMTSFWLNILRTLLSQKGRSSDVAALTTRSFCWANVDSVAGKSGDTTNFAVVLENGKSLTDLFSVNEFEVDEGLPDDGLPDSLLSKLTVAQQLVVAFSNRARGYNLPTALGLTTFGSKVEQACEVTNDTNSWRLAVEALEPDTHLYDALVEAAEELKEFQEEFEQCKRLRVLVFSDGVDSGSKASQMEAATRLSSGSYR